MGTCSANLTPKDPLGCLTFQRSQTFLQTLLQNSSVAPNFNSVPHRAPSAPTQLPYGSLRSTWAISQIPWDSRNQPDISIELKMGSCAPLPPPHPDSQLPKLLSIPKSLESLGLLFLGKPDPLRYHTDSAGLETSYPESYPAFQTNPRGERNPLALQVRRLGGLQLQAGMGIRKGKESQLPRVKG